MFRFKLFFLLCLILSVRLCSAADKDVDFRVVTFAIPNSYGLWTINDKLIEHKGKAAVKIPVGKNVIVGKEFGWKLEFLLDNQNIIPQKIIPGTFGRDLSGMFCHGENLTMLDPEGKRVIISIPRVKGEYRIDGLLPNGVGARAVFLPKGKRIIHGKDWKIELDISENNSTAKFIGNSEESFSFDNNIFRWINVDNISVSSALKPKLKVFVNRDKKYFRRDEYILINVSLTSDEAKKDKLTVSAVQGENEIVFLERRWSTVQGVVTRSFEIPLYVLKSGKYLLKARLAGLESSCSLEILPSSTEQKGLVPLVNIARKRDEKNLSEKGFNGCFIGIDDFLAAMPEGLSAKIDYNIVLAKPGKDFDYYSRKTSMVASHAREYGGVRSFVVNFKNDKLIGGGLIEKVADIVGAQTDNIFIRTFINIEDFLKLKNSSSIVNNAFVFGLEKHLKNDIANLFKLRADSDFSKTMMVVRENQYAWAALVLGSKGVASKGLFDNYFLQRWNNLGLFVSTIMEEYYKKEKKPIFKIPDDKNTVIVSFEQQDVAYCLVFSKKACSATLPLFLNKNNVYDLFAAKRLYIPARVMVFKQKMKDNDFKAFAFLKNKPSSIRLKLRARSSRKIPYLMRCYAVLVDESNRIVRASVPAKIEIKTKNGKVVASLNRTFKAGILDYGYPLALNHPKGSLLVEISTVGVKTSAIFHNKTMLRNYTRNYRERTIVEEEDFSSILDFIEKENEFTIAIGGIDYLREAELLATNLKRKGKKANVKFLNEVLADQKIAEAMDNHIPMIDISENLILIGLPSDNFLIDIVANKAKLTPYQITKLFPGNGKGLLQYAWKAFSFKHDAIVVSSSDEHGVKLAVRRLISLR